MSDGWRFLHYGARHDSSAGFPPLQRHEGAGTTIPLIHKGEADGLLPALPRNAVPGDCPPGAGLSADHHPVM